jgi:hypothetical protein
MKRFVSCAFVSQKIEGWCITHSNFYSTQCVQVDTCRLLLAMILSAAMVYWFSLITISIRDFLPGPRYLWCMLRSTTQLGRRLLETWWNGLKLGFPEDERHTLYSLWGQTIAIRYHKIYVFEHVWTQGMILGQFQGNWHALSANRWHHLWYRTESGTR